MYGYIRIYIMYGHVCAHVYVYIKADTRLGRLQSRGFMRGPSCHSCTGLCGWPLAFPKAFDSIEHSYLRGRSVAAWSSDDIYEAVGTMLGGAGGAGGHRCQ